MPRSRDRLTLESGPTLNLARLIPRGAGRPGHHFHAVVTCANGEVIRAEIVLQEHGGRLNVSSQGKHQSFELTSDPRPFGGRLWYIVCPKTCRRVRVLLRPLGATWFASRHAWGSRQAAYASQFLNPID